MENPLEQEVPEDVIERIEHFSRDFAFGVKNECDTNWFER